MESRLALGTIRSPVQRVPKALSPVKGRKLNTHHYLELRLRMRGTTPTPSIRLHGM
jgi:hypothetical protein